MPHYNKMKDLQVKFKGLLLSTKREGMENVITCLEKQGFFEAPASTRFHLSHAGGLLEHSMNVCDMALELRELMIRKKECLLDMLPKDSVIISSLLHDVCKADIYKAAIKKQKNAMGIWTPVAGYDVDYSCFPLGHGEKSVIWLLQNGLKLTTDEIIAIRWHMTAWDLPFQSPEMKGNLNAAKDRCPLLSLIQAADGLAANILEA